MSKSFRIDGERLWADLTELGKIGFKKEKGITRTALSSADLQARKWFTERMEAAGLEIREDQACNMIGVLKSPTAKSSKVAAVGSHLDTVPQGGMFDGALGVLAALECIRTIRDCKIALPWNLELINFTDEEGRHHAGTMGSRAMLGLLTENDLRGTRKKGDISLSESLSALGKQPSIIHQAIRKSEDFEFFLELHIEQGKLLESEHKTIGAVTGIAGISRFLVTTKGEAGHSGTSPMHLRDDALVKAAPLFTLLPQWVMERNPLMVGTIGKIDISPGASNVIPETCNFVVELRSQLEEDLDYVYNLLKTYVAGRQGFNIKHLYHKPPRLLDKEMIDAVIKAAEQEQKTHLRMASGAGHDAHTFAPYVPTGMIFVPCRNGISHSRHEWVEKEDAASGCQVLLQTILQLAKNAIKL